MMRSSLKVTPSLYYRRMGRVSDKIIGNSARWLTCIGTSCATYVSADPEVNFDLYQNVDDMHQGR